MATTPDPTPVAADPTLAAVVLAAGKGTRMKSERAKVLHEICGRPLAAFAVARAQEAGAGAVVVVVGHQADLVRAALAPRFPAARFALQAEQKGTGHAVLCAMESLPREAADVLVLSGDVPLVRAETLRAAVEARRARGAAVAVVSMQPPSPRGYGRIVADGEGGVRRIVEEKDATDDERRIRDVNAGIYCIDRAFLAEALRELSPANAQGEYYLTDVVHIARGRGRAVVAVAADFAQVSGINDRAELAAAETALRRDINLAHMRAGVTLRDPATAYIDEGVVIGADSEIGPSVSLQGSTRLGRNVRVAQGCVLVDTVVEDGTEVKPYSHLESAVVGQRCQVGPFARLRPGTELAEEVHVGNFVETKKARLGAKSKANHLTYLGDAVIGKGCNIGAGTITCNYDGVNKHPTVMGDGVFIGSDTQLVAPVTLGDGAYVGAGATITKDVPADTLAVTRAPLTMKEGWPSRRKAQMQAEKARKQQEQQPPQQEAGPKAAAK